MKLELPIVRPRALPADMDRLEWREGPDLPAVAMVMLSGAIGGWLGMLNLMRGASGQEASVALVFVGVGGILILAALLELVREEIITVEDGEVHVSRRAFGGRRAWTAPLASYRGVVVEERGRRFFVRNQGLPATGRRGPVSEFVLVLRHAEDRARDLDLFRAQPSLTVLQTMHAVRASKGGPDVDECERVARGYGDALRSLCTALGKPALVAVDGVETEHPADGLDLWLQPAGAATA